MLLAYIKKSASNTFAYGITLVLVRGINFLFLPYFLSHLTLYELGIWDWYQTWFSLGTFLLSSCAATAMTRFALLHKDDTIKKYQAIGNAFLFALAGLCSAIFIAILAITFNIISCNSWHSIATFLNIILFVLFSLVSAYLYMQERLLLYSLSFFAQNFIALALTVFGVKLGYGIYSFFYATTFSLIPFIPWFFILLKKYNYQNFNLFKEQIGYAGPMLLHGILFTLFFSVDRWILQHNKGFDELGIYSLLWRFGSIFQILTFAVTNAFPLVYFQAQKEQNAHALINRLFIYFCLVLTTGCLCAIVGARFIISLIAPIAYHYLLDYLPSFFIPLLLVALAQLLFIGCALAVKSTIIPLSTAIILATQLLLLLLFGKSISGIIIANSIAFLMYAFLGYCASVYTYGRFLHIRKIITIFTFFGLYTIGLQILLFYRSHWFLLVSYLATWPLTLWLSGIIIDEIIWLTKMLQNFIIYSVLYFLKKPTPVHSLPIVNSVLCLRTDLGFAELTMGGSVSKMIGVIQGWQNVGVRVICASSAMNSVLAKISDISLIKLSMPPLFCFLRWKFAHLRWRLDCFFSNIFFLIQLRRIIREKSFDVIYHRYSLLNVTGALISAITKLPLILDYNGSEVWIYKTWGERYWFQFDWLAEIIEAVNLQAADCIVVVSEPLKDELVKKNIDPGKILIKPNGVDTAYFDPMYLEPIRIQQRASHCLQEAFIIGFTGTFSFWHGIEILEYMIPRVVAKLSNVHFLLIGDGILKKNLEEQLRESDALNHVTFTGSIPQDQVREYLALCDAFICPTQPNSDGSRFFGSPIKMFEYLSMAKPIIASDLEQLKDIIKPAITYQEIVTSSVNLDNKIGILVPPCNKDAFVEATCWLAALGYDQQKIIGLQARDRAIAHFTWARRAIDIKNFILGVGHG
jgi:glycosyltransferase involved in cell wall biosynthesis/O-antigen/teichoic acid export membrane protein